MPACSLELTPSRLRIAVVWELTVCSLLAVQAVVGIHSGGEAAENGLLGGRQFAVFPERAAKPRQDGFNFLLITHGLMVHLSTLPVADSSPQVEARRPM